MKKFRGLFAVAVVTALACGGRQTMQVDRKPIAGFKFTQSTVRPQVFVFDAAESQATVGTLAKYKWLFGDEASGGAPTEVTTSTAQHAYKAAGTFTVTLVVSDDKGVDSDAVTKEVMVATVNNDGPLAMITGPNQGQPNMQFTFDGSTSTPTGDIQNYAWDFGDGMTVMGKDKSIVQHAFSAANRFRVTLTVTDSLGQSNTGELQIAVGDVGPLAVCTWTPSTVYMGSPVSFSGAQSTAPSGSTIVVYVWDFGDGVMNVPGMTVQHTYTGAGPYTPKLRVVDSNSKSHETSCAQVMPGVPPLCAGDYSLSANPTRVACAGGLGFANWAGIRWTMTEMVGGAITATEMFGGQTLTYTGTYTGSTFTMTGHFNFQSTQMGLLVDEVHDVTVLGTWTGGCTGWTGTYRDQSTATTDFMGTPIDLGGCDATFNISSMKL